MKTTVRSAPDGSDKQHKKTNTEKKWRNINILGFGEIVKVKIESGPLGF